MASRRVLAALQTNKTPTVEDVNIIYRILTGQFDPNKAHGISVQLTAFDGKLAFGTQVGGVITGASGFVDTTHYALEVRNRETGARLTAAFRDANNDILLAIEGGKVKAVDPDSSPTPVTTRASVIVHGTNAGGVLRGSYPNPTFAAATEYYVLYPTMIMAWYGSAATSSVSAGWGGHFNTEVAACPGWVFLNGSNTSVYLRDGSTILTAGQLPNMTDRLPIGPGAITYQTTGGVAWGSLSAITIAHQHNHTHTVPSHTHTITEHVHSLNGHTHDVTISHTHSIPTHTHGLHFHVHDMSGHTHSADAHTHDLSNHLHGLGSHTHSLAAHTHTAGTLQTAVHAFDSETDATNTVVVNGGTGVTVSLANHHHLSPKTATTLDTTTGVSAGPSSNTSGAPSAASDGPSVNATGPISGASATGGPSTTNTGNTANALDTTDASSASNTGGASTATFTSVGPDAGHLNTGNTSPTTTGTGGTPLTTDPTSTAISTGTTSVNAQPPVLAWHWIMKL